MAPNDRYTFNVNVKTPDGEYKELGTVENITDGIELMKAYCVVTDPGVVYPLFDNWINKYFPTYSYLWKGENHSQLLPDRLYRVIGCKPHLEHDWIRLCLIQDLDTKEVFIIEDAGINICVATKVERYTTECAVATKAEQYTTECAVVNKYEIRKGENNMNNEVLNLWKKRKQDDINKKYNDIVTKEYESLEVRKEYKELIETFEKDLDALIIKYNTNADINDLPLLRTGYAPEYGVELNDGIRYSIAKKYEEEQNKEYSELMDLVEEIKAQLSLSNDKDYQIDVLTRYDILKKGKLNI